MNERLSQQAQPTNWDSPPKHACVELRKKIARLREALCEVLDTSDSFHNQQTANVRIAKIVKEALKGEGE